MKQAGLAKWLKIITVGTGICGIVIYFYMLPFWGKQFIQSNATYSNYYWPWLIFLWITAVPCYSVLVFIWRIASEIGKDNSFSKRNASYLKIISVLTASNAGFLFVGNILFLLLKISHPVIVLISLIIVFLGIAFSVGAAALSHLILKAAILKEENELTI